MAFRTDIDALVLAVLQTETLHGYEISKRINAFGNTVFKVKEGQLYPILHRLENAGEIAAEWMPQEGKPARKLYSLTEHGHKELARQKEAWREFSKSVDGVMLGNPGVQHG